jgi:hypothetical protein
MTEKKIWLVKKINKKQKSEKQFKKNQANDKKIYFK